MKKLLCITVAAIALGSSVTQAASTTVVTETRVTPRPLAGPDIVDFRVFDVNNDGTMTMAEVGEKLFYTFDADGNQLVDNIEWNRPMVYTFAPMERQTVQYVDYNSDGSADVTTSVSSEVFLQQTGLSRFDKHANGLTAAEFLDKPFKKADRDWSGQIDIKEWKEAYIASLRPLPQNDTFRYND